MGNSSMVNYTKLSPNYSKGRNGEKICRITIHHMAGNLTVQQCGNIFAPTTRQASSNYGVSGSSVGLYVNECDRAWTSSNGDNDRKAVTLEIANDAAGVKNKTWTVSDETLKTTIKLCADIMKRNGLTKAVYIEDKTKALAYKLQPGECLFTRHNMFAATSCPGPYVQSKMPYIVEEVNKLISIGEAGAADSKTIYRVQVGAYSVKKNSDAMLKKMQSLGYKDAFVTYDTKYYRVQVGAFSKYSNAVSLANSLKAQKIDTFIVKVTK